MFKTTSAARLVLLGAASVVVLVGITAVAYGTANNPTPVDPEPTSAVASAPAADAVSVVAIVDALDQTDADGIAFMREEEKLARDVYLTLADVWDLRIFSNIARAEQTHMDSILGLLDAYGLRDPAGNNDVGVFENPELQQMYDELTSSGSQSIEAALNVGALIEEVDIEDLAIYLDATLPTDVATVYDRLLNGSENHLRAFVSQLERVGINHQPTVLDADIYESIISSESQQGGRQTDKGPGHGAGGRGRNA